MENTEVFGGKVEIQNEKRGGMGGRVSAVGCGNSPRERSDHESWD